MAEPTTPEIGRAQAAWLNAAILSTPGGNDATFPWPMGFTKIATQPGGAGGFAKYVWALGLSRLYSLKASEVPGAAEAIAIWISRKDKFTQANVHKWLGASDREPGSIDRRALYGNCGITPEEWNENLDVRKLVSAAVGRLVDEDKASALLQQYPYGDFASVADRYAELRTLRSGASTRARLERVVDRARAARTREFANFHMYDPKHYVPRKDAHEAWAAFLSSKRRTFAFFGESGRGKTSTLCNLISELAKTTACVLYNGLDLGPSLIEQVAKDLLGEVPENPLAALRGIFDRDPVVIAVDALNSYQHNREELRRELDLLKDVADETFLRLVVSCTPTAWSDFRLTSNGGETKFARSLFLVDPVGSGRTEGFLLKEFTGPELQLAWAGYGLEVELTEQIRQLVEIPEAMRLFSTMPSAAGHTTSPTLAALIDAYVVERCRKNPEGANRILSKLAELMLEHESLHLSPTALEFNLDDEDILRLLDDQAIIKRTSRSLSFRSDVMAEHFIGLVAFDRLFQASGAVGELDSLRYNQLEILPGAIDAAFRIAEDEGGFEKRLKACVEEVATWGPHWSVVASLAVERTPSLFPDLLMALSASESYLIRETAARALSGSAHLVVDAGRSENWRTRETAALSYRYAECGGLLCGALWLLAGDRHWRVRRAAGYVMQKTWGSCSPHLTTKIRAAMAEPGQFWKQCHALLIALAGEASLGDAVEHEDVAAFLVKCARSANRQLRWLAAYYLPRYSRHAVDELASVLSQDDDPWIRATYAASLVDIIMRVGSDSGLAAGQLSELCADLDPTVRIRVARAMGARRSGTFDKELRALAADDHLLVSAAAKYAIDPGTLESSVDLIAERIALQDTDPVGLAEGTHGDLANMSKFITDRLAIRFVDDPYVYRFETMRALFSAAIQQFADGDGELPLFLDRMVGDPDEGVRWALVLCLAGPDLHLEPKTFVGCLTKLALDTHMWVRREVADSLPHLVGGARLPIALAWDLIDRMRNDSAMNASDFHDEVASFIGIAEKQLRLDHPAPRSDP